MLVILRENVENLGRVGDVVKVSDGYARNFLLPHALVFAADEKNLQVVEHHKRALEKKRLAARASASEFAKKLSGQVITLHRKVGEGDRLFGSVTSSDVIAGLRAAGFPVEKRDLRLENPIKALGTHDVLVFLEKDIEATVKIVVAKEA